MSLYSAFSTSILGMQSLTHALGTISQNLANVNTGGFKGTETRFETILGDVTSDSTNFKGSVAPTDIQLVSRQGQINGTGRTLDIAIAGKGFFTVNTDINGTGDTFYTRDGSLAVAAGNDITVTGNNGQSITVQEGYLVDKNGYYIQGWTADATGNFTNSGSLASLRVDNFAFTNLGQATTTADLSLNLPASDAAGSVHIFAMEVVDSDIANQVATLNFTKGVLPGQWTVSVTTGNPGDTITSVPQALTFDGSGQLTGTTTYTVAVDWASGATSSVDVDLQNTTQFAGPFLPLSFDRNGFLDSPMTDFSFDQFGRVIANFDDLTTRPIYKMPLAIFVNPDGLEERSGNVYAESTLSGTAQNYAADNSEFGIFIPNSYEGSNVDVEREFTRMIAIQHAYSANAMAFKTADELTQMAADLIR